MARVRPRPRAARDNARVVASRREPRRAPRLEPAASAPSCPHFGPCGGCSWLDRPYGEQLARKQEIVAKALAAAGVAVAPRAVEPSPHPARYRTRLLYPLASVGGRVVAGFFRRGTHEPVDVRSCAIQDPAITQIANRLRAA